MNMIIIIAMNEWIMIESNENFRKKKYSSASAWLMFIYVYL